MRQVRWLEVDGGRIPVLSFGDPAGPPVLLVPGLSDGLAPLSEHEAARAVPPPPRHLRRYHVVVSSHRHPLPPTPTTASLAADAADVLARLFDGRPAVVAGHSMGAMVTQHLVAKRPELVRAAILSATVPRADEAVSARLRHWDDLLVAGDWRGFYQDALAASYTGSDLLRRRIRLRVSSAPALNHLLPRHLALSRACRSHDARAGLSRIACPVLVLAGEHDPIARPQGARELAAAIPSARLQVLRGVAHGFPEQARGLYGRLLSGFMRALPDDGLAASA